MHIRSCLSDLTDLSHTVMKSDKCEVTEAQLNIVRLLIKGENEIHDIN